MPPLSHLTSLICLKGPLEIQVVSELVLLQAEKALVLFSPACSHSSPPHCLATKPEDGGQDGGPAPRGRPHPQIKPQTQATGHWLESQGLSKAFSLTWPGVGDLKTGRGQEFPGDPVVKTLDFHCRGHGLDPWSGN